MARNQSERFPYSQGVYDYLVLWTCWDAAGRPSGDVAKAKRKSYRELTSADRRVLKGPLWRADLRREFCRKHHIHAA